MAGEEGDWVGDVPGCTSSGWNCSPYKVLRRGALLYGADSGQGGVGCERPVDWPFTGGTEAISPLKWTSRLGLSDCVLWSESLPLLSSCWPGPGLQQSVS